MPRLAGAFRSVRAGTLDDTSWLRPTVHIWARSKQPWITLPDGDRHLRKRTDTRLIQDYLGHKDIKNTVVYTETSQRRLAAVRVR
jgi:integrase